MISGKASDMTRLDALERAVLALGCMEMLPGHPNKQSNELDRQAAEILKHIILEMGGKWID